MSRSKKTKKSVGAAIVMLVIMAILAAGSWIYHHQIDTLTSGGESQKYRNITFTDATLICREYTQDRYKERLQRLTFDAHSSRWDNRAGRYKIFFRAVIQGRNGRFGPADYFVSCDVSGRKGAVRDYDVVQKRNTKSEVQRQDDGGMFGWP